jgi:hypothetical protein
MGRGDASRTRTPVGRRSYRLLSDVDGAKSMKLRCPFRRRPEVAARGRRAQTGAVLWRVALEGRRPAEEWIPGSPALRSGALE